jgi:hypothetical protein
MRSLANAPTEERRGLENLPTENIGSGTIRAESASVDKAVNPNNDSKLCEATNNANPNATVQRADKGDGAGASGEVAGNASNLTSASTQVHEVEKAVLKADSAIELQRKDTEQDQTDNGEEKAGTLVATAEDPTALPAHGEITYAQVKPAATEQNAEAASRTQNTVEQKATSILVTGPNKNDMLLGEAVIEWFQKANLQEDHPLSQTMRGAFVEGKIIGVNKQENGTKYKLSFDVLTMGENWYSEEDTRLYHGRFLKSKVVTLNEPSNEAVQGLLLSNSSEAMTIAPTCLYTMEDKLLKRRCFPCPDCAQPANGSHQCGACFAHVHVVCGTPYENAPESFGQLLLCQDCEPATTANDTRQPYDHADSSQTPPEERERLDSLSRPGEEGQRGALAGFLKAALVTASKAALAGHGSSLQTKL